MIRTYERWREERFFPRLEGIRAVAALLVVFHHARANGLWGAVAGWNGVTLFFVLSGFLITTLGLREEERLGALRWGAFFVRRAFRILPLYLVSLTLYAGLVLVVGLGAAHRESFVHALPWYLSPFPEHVFFGHAHAAFALSWSLGIEEKFYFVWPLLAFVLLRRRFRTRLAVALAAAVAFQVPVAIWAGGRVVAPPGSGGRSAPGLSVTPRLGPASPGGPAPAGGVAHETIALPLGISLSVGAAYALPRVVGRPLVRGGRGLAARETFVLFEP